MKSIKLICKKCLKKYTPTTHQLYYVINNKISKWFCSKNCRYSFLSGKNHPMWVGIGKPKIHKVKNKRRAYIRINGKSFKYPRYIMEKHIGRKLFKNEVVHHKNGITSDDRICNLQVMTNKEHSAHHIKETQLWKFKKKRGINTFCKNCYKEIYIQPWRTKISKNGYFFCSSYCNGKYYAQFIKKPPNVSCTNCKKRFKKAPSHIHFRNFCCRNCHNKFGNPKIKHL